MQERIVEWLSSLFLGTFFLGRLFCVGSALPGLADGSGPRNGVASGPVDSHPGL
jgi:hypothetical protein